MKKVVYRFSSIFNIIVIFVFTCFIATISFAVLFLGDERNIFACVLAILLFLFCIVCLFYFFRNKIIITPYEIIYVGFTKNKILKKDILQIESNGLRIIIKTEKKTYIFAGYMLNSRWNMEKDINKNKRLVEIIKQTLCL